MTITVLYATPAAAGQSSAWTLEVAPPLAAAAAGETDAVTATAAGAVGVVVPFVTVTESVSKWFSKKPKTVRKWKKPGEPKTCKE